MRKRLGVEIEAGGRRLVLVELFPSELLKAVKSSQGEPSEGAAELEIAVEGLRLSLRRIDDQPVGYIELMGGLIDKRLKLRHINAGIDAWKQVHQPTEAEIEAVLSQMVVAEDAEGETYTVTLPPAALVEGAVPRSITFREQTTAGVKAAARAGDAHKSMMGRALAMSIAVLRLSLITVDGKEVSNLGAADWDDLFSVRETQLLYAAWQSVHGGTPAGGLKPISGIA